MSCVIAIRVTPRASKPGLGSWRKLHDGREELEIRVSALPVEGAANEAVVRLLAKALEVPRSQVSIISGAAGRHKRVALPVDADEARRRLGQAAG